MGLGGKVSRWLGLWKNQFSLKRVENIKCEENDRVLIIKLDAIGDFIIWLDSAKEYRNIFSGKHIVLLCNSLCKDIAEVTNYFDEIKTLNIGKCETDPEYFKEQIDSLSKNSYNDLIQTAYSRTQHMDILAASIPAHKKIGFIADESKSNVSRSVVSKRNRKYLDNIYDTLIPSSSRNLMELKRNGEMIRNLGEPSFKSSIPELPQIKDVATPKGKYFIVFAGASTATKMWRNENFASVINHVLKITDWKCLICGGKNEKNLANNVISGVFEKNRVDNYCGRTSLIELIEIVRNSKLVISNDTSGIHFAAATGTRGVCPLGEYNYGRFLPYDADTGYSSISVCTAGMKCRNCSSKHMSLRCYTNIIVKGRYLCLEKITSESVVQAISTMLKEDSISF